MNVIINIGNKSSSLEILEQIRSNDYVPFDVRITNSHITELNKVIGKTIFRKDALYINSRTLWEVMQPIGGKGKHHYHGLSPEVILDVLQNLKHSKTVVSSYNGRYLVVVLCTDKTDYAIILEPNGTVKGNIKNNVVRVITLYPYEKK